MSSVPHDSVGDVAAVSHLILRERQARDRGWWAPMRDSYRPAAPVFLSWIDGSAEEFVTRSKAMFDAGERPVHRLAPPVVEVHRDRAVAEVGAAIVNHVTIHGVQANLVSHGRLLYQASRTEDRWWIASLTAIYEDSTLTPSLPDTSIPYELAVLRGVRPSYRYLGYYLARSGWSTQQGLYGDDEPDHLHDLYEHAYAWLHNREQAAGRPR
ncbi:hypothetical protein CFN78_16560 [Amycolatopsis antarctica]|uniref:SnoaL-like domain-containing protein n=1 Tax=Amycolatopsis antarctica TaxID=1854586 RepID=A0A263D3W4_9PSEU|nr:nuclear transport factor 2 family protein [Amycolatopsis antarctica]OZM72146.1 hypothetical protein CFN78_16560 [Amycolatopsis antarctica]